MTVCHAPTTVQQPPLKRPSVPCPDCGKPVRRDSINRHWRKVHSGTVQHTDRYYLGVEIDHFLSFGWTAKNVASRLGCPVDTVKTRIRRREQAAA